MDVAQHKLLLKNKLLQLLAPFPIKLSVSKSKGRFIKAETDIKAGTTILKEKSAAFVLLRENLEDFCDFCSKQLTHDAIACEGCRKQTFYCNQVCMENSKKFHSLECKPVTDLRGLSAFHKVDYNLFRLIIKLLVKEHFDSNSDNEHDVSLFDLVYKMISHEKLQNENWLKAVTNAAIDLVESSLPFKVDAKKVVTLACIINSNSHGIYNPHSSTNDIIGLGLFPLTALINHSCVPNCVFLGADKSKLSDENDIMVRTLTDVKKGDEIVVSYLDLWSPNVDRRLELLATKHFWCECSRCNSSDGDIISAIHCEGCREGIYVNNTTSTQYSCEKCKSVISTEELNNIQNCAKLEFEASFELYKNGHAALGELEIILNKMKEDGLLLINGGDGIDYKKEAKFNFNKSLEIRELIYGFDHQKTLMTRGELALIEDI
ncbi:hypothetical protein HK099_005832 [Clydaea vesicula]|uniref:SET domain-containing protein n=1 Tax=Clydaea vesicula TaxID=447962 RepID=A0AAD5TY96_9FUNG|nr:hypothetical protein HK099_005832 [Clydaea vesicula]